MGAQSTATPVGLGGGTPGTRSFNESRLRGWRAWGTGTARLAALAGDCACQVLPVSAASQRCFIRTPRRIKQPCPRAELCVGSSLGPFHTRASRGWPAGAVFPLGPRTHRWHHQASGASPRLRQHRRQHSTPLAPGSWHRAQETGPWRGMESQSLQPCPFPGVPLCQTPGPGARVVVAPLPQRSAACGWRVSLLPQLHTWT